MAVLRAGFVAAATAPYLVRVARRRPYSIAAATLTSVPTDEATLPVAFPRRSCAMRPSQRRYFLHQVVRETDAGAQWHVSCRSSMCVRATSVLATAASSVADPVRSSSGTSGATSGGIRPSLNRASPAGASDAKWMAAAVAPVTTAAYSPLLQSSVPVAAAVGSSTAAPDFCCSPAYGIHNVRQQLLLARRYGMTWFLSLTRCCSSRTAVVSVAEYCLRPRCKYAPTAPTADSSGAPLAPARSEGEQMHISRSTSDSSTRCHQASRMSDDLSVSISGSRSKSSSCSSGSSGSSNSNMQQTGRRHAGLGREGALLRGPGDPIQAALPVLSFDFFTDACCNAKCRAEAIVGEVRTQTPRSFKLLIDGSAYALMGGLLLLLLTSNLTVVERRVDAHVKSLALLAAAYGAGIALWGCEVAALGKRSVFPAGAPRQGFALLHCDRNEITRYIFGLVSLWLCVPVLVLPESVGPVAAYAALMLPVALQMLLPRLLFTEKQRRESTGGWNVRCGGGWLPQWWGSSRSQQLLPFAALASAAVGMLYVSRVEARATSEIDAAAAEAAASLNDAINAEVSYVTSSSSPSNKHDISNNRSEGCNSSNRTDGSCFKNSRESRGNSSALEDDRGWRGKLAKILFPAPGAVSGGAAAAGWRAQTAEEVQREREDQETLNLTRKRLLSAKEQRQQNALQQEEPQPLKQQQKTAKHQSSWKQEDTGDDRR